MASAPKLKRRIGFALDNQGRSRTLARGGGWAPAVVREARWLYLSVFARECPRAMAELSRLPYGDASALDAWLARWGLQSTDPTDDWARAHAEATRRAWARFWSSRPQPRKLYWFDRGDLSGQLCDDTLPREARPLKHVEHFLWLVHHQVGAQIVRAADRKTVREAVAILAERLGLHIRTPPRGPRRRRCPNSPI